MKYEYAYELVAAVFLISVAVGYSTKNWLSLRANHIFSILVKAALAFTLLDVVIRSTDTSALLQSIHIKYILSQISCLEMVGTFALFYIYFLALSGHLKSVLDNRFLITMVPAMVLVVLVVTTPWNHSLYYYDEAGVYHFSRSFWVMIVSYLYAFGMCGLAFLSPDFLDKRDGLLCLALTFAHMVIVVLQYAVLKNKILLSFYFSDFMVVVFYLHFQNMDRFLDKMSGGFSRAGFRRVVKEKYHYKEKFGVLFINIQNYSNICSMCSEQEVYEIMGKIGLILRRHGGRHNQFHIHGSDFVVMRRTEEELVKLYQKVFEEMPEVFRINNRNIAINYSYYVLTMEEAGYEESEFFKMLSSMKKQLNHQTDSRRLMRYEGEVQKEVDLELYIGRKLKKILQEERCELRFFPVMHTLTGKCHALETSIYLARENGKAVSEDAIWSVARELGYMKELGRIVTESTMECVTRGQVLQKGINEVAINVTPLHVCSAASIHSLKEVAEKYQFPLDRFCMELTEDMSVSYDVMREYLNDLKEAGVSLILDRYGENVCNLQGIMTMPFRTVKVSSQMVQRYCRGESDILEYQIRMLQEHGWKICLAGIDNKEQYEKVKDLEVTYLQGLYFSRLLAPEQLHYVFDAMENE